ncbi:MAG: hypothetical protein QOJ01_632 [Solirubrobacterales bacterium]|nr:hypothetical protein [Solirubrobacterales bacterium]
MKQAESPVVSVVIPVYNGERFLAEAIESVLAQNYEPLEIIVVDDGSTDGSAAIAERYPVILLRGLNRGRSQARNAGIEAASGELVGFCDADDVWLGERLNLQVRHLLDHPEEGAVACMMEVFVEPGIERPRWLRGVLAETRRSLMPSALLIRREVLDRVGGFDPRFEVGEDGDLMLRMKESGVRMGSVDRVLFRYRIHDANSLHDREHHRKALFRVIHESVKRKRRLPGAQA